MSRVLEVWLLGRHVGKLAQVDGRLRFSYSPHWLQSAGAIPLSHSLPLRVEPFDDKAARSFFAGLLPEGDKRTLIANVPHVSRQNDFSLLDGIGGECAGAVTLLEPGRRPGAVASTPTDRWLDDGELVAILDDLPRRPMLAGRDGLRLSLAGAQDKLPASTDFQRFMPGIGSSLHKRPDCRPRRSNSGFWRSRAGCRRRRKRCALGSSLTAWVMPCWIGSSNSSNIGID